MKEEPIDEAYGRAVRLARKVKGMRTQSELADVIGRSSKMVQHYEAGRYLTPEVRGLLERALGEALTGTTGDPVEGAIEKSRLTPDRQSFVIGTYRQALRLQDAEDEERRRGA